MKILHILYDDFKNPWLGGGGAVRAREINKILAQKHSVTTITGNFPGACTESMDNITFIRIGYGAHYLLSRITYTLAVPFQMWIREYDLIVNDFSAFSPVFCHFYTKKPIVNIFHHRLGIQAIKKKPILGLLSIIFEKLFLKTASNVITGSPSVTEDIKRKNEIRRIECIFSGVDQSLFALESEPGEYIGFIGRLDVYMKGIDILLNALKKIKNSTVTLKIAGSGPQKNIKSLIATIDTLKLKDRVTLLGKISDTEKRDFFKRSLFFVMPSRFEGWGISAIEAAACGKPVIGTDIPGLKDAIIDKKTGFLVESENSDELAVAIDTLLENKKLRNELGCNGKKWAKNFQWEEIAEQQEQFYKDTVYLY